MSDKPTQSEHLLQLINDLGAEAAHTDAESETALSEAGLPSGQFADDVRERTRWLLALDRARLAPRVSTFHDRARTWSLVAIAASVMLFVVTFTINHRAEIAAQRRLSESTARLVRLDTARNRAYAARIFAGLQKLELSRDPDDRKVAIWNDLLPVLQEARKNRDDFMDVALDYQRVLPLLRVRDPEVFLDCYWGELWILNILLDSRIAPVVQAARRQAPEPAVVDRIFEQNAGTLPDRDRQAFAEAVTVYKAAFNGAR
jgi:hypothetical protein